MNCIKPPYVDKGKLFIKMMVSKAEEKILILLFELTEYVGRTQGAMLSLALDKN